MVCSSSDPVGGVLFSLCGGVVSSSCCCWVGRGNKRGPLLLRITLYWSALDMSWLYRPGLYSTCALMRIGARMMCAGLYISCLTWNRCVVKLEMVSTSILGQNYDLWPQIRGRSEVSSEAALPYTFCEEKGGRGAGAQLTFTCLPSKGDKVHMGSLSVTYRP